MARYSIEDTTLTALGDATRRIVGETRLEDVEYTSKAYRLDSSIHNSSLTALRIPVCGATKIVITRIATDRDTVTLYPVDCSCKEVMFPMPVSCPFTLLNFTSDNVGFYTITSGVIFDFEASWYDENDEQMTVTFEEDVTNTLTPGGMAEALNNYDMSMMIPDKAIVLTGNSQYRFAYNNWNWFIENCGDKVTTQDMRLMSNMFLNADALVSIPFDINAKQGSSSSVSYIFSGCKKLTEVPSIKNLRVSSMNYLCGECHLIKSIPNDWTDTWDWSDIDNSTSAYGGNMDNIFNGCYNLRSVPTWFFLHGNPVANNSYSSIYYAFQHCHSLEKVEGIRLPANVTWTSNAFNSTFQNCYRLKSVTFALQPDGSPYVHNIKNQTIDLTTAGYVATSSKSQFLSRCPDFTEANIIDNYDKWEAYFGDPFADKSAGGSGNGFAVGTEYSTFTRTAVKRLFKTLPDVTGGSSNVIKLSRSAGSAMKAREAMTNLTEEEIAVATARGWTVTLA